jgi:hypothetical protein
VPALNTPAAKGQNTHEQCLHRNSIAFKILGGNVDLTPQTASVLIFETGQ